MDHEQGRCTDSLPSLPSVLCLANSLPLFSVLLKAPQKWGEKKGKDGVQGPLPTLSPESYTLCGF